MSYFARVGYEHYNGGRSLALAAFGFQKDLWRAGLLECPSACAADAPAAVCKCGCPGLSAWLRPGAAAARARVDAMGVANMVDAARTTTRDGADASGALLRALCNDADDDFAPAIGDLNNAGAPADPLFWVLHPTVDRLWHAARLRGFDDESWPDDGGYAHRNRRALRDAAAADDGARGAAAADDDGARGAAARPTCAGHGAADVTAFTRADLGVAADARDGARHVTNAELYALLDPRDAATAPVACVARRRALRPPSGGLFPPPRGDEAEARPRHRSRLLFSGFTGTTHSNGRTAPT